ncbi:ABC transporter ATP-binding protein/permease [Amylibacter sp.]|nr:ABC transporter ATP-binding protein/permease [Amylibacter sp.]
MKNNPLFSFPVFFMAYRNHLGSKIYILVFLLVISGFLDGFGIIMLLPLIEGSKYSNGDITAHNDYFSISHIINKLLNFFNIDDNITGIIILLIAIFLLKGVVYFLSQAFFASLRAKLLEDLKSSLFYKTIEMKYEASMDFSSSDLTNLFNDQITRCLATFTNLNFLLVQITNSIIYLSFIFLIAPTFGLIVSVAGIFILSLFKKLNVFVRSLSHELTTQMGNTTKIFQETIRALKYLKATSQFRPFFIRMDKSLERLRTFNFKIGLAGSFTQAAREPLVVSVMLALVIFERQTSNTPMSEMLIILALFYRALNSLVGIQGYGQNMLDNSAALETIETYLNNASVFTERKSKVLSGQLEAINLKKLNFTYKNTEIKAIKDITLCIKKGEFVGLIGGSGSGKSTILNILAGIIETSDEQLLYLNNEGKIIDVRSLNIGYVCQDSVIFESSVDFNVTLSDEPSKINFEKLQSILETLKLSDLSKLNNVGEGGSKLSGGQKQRLFLARELYRDVDILLLDEPTSALDYTTEATIKLALEKLRGQTTIIMAAHRITTLEKSDKVFKLDRGELIWTGSFNDIKIG